MSAATQEMITGAVASLDALLGLRFLPLRLKAHQQTRTGEPGGGRLSRLRGRGIDFAEVRLYQPGDDVRNIDWRVTARKTKPHTKVYREERERPTLVLVDQSRRMRFGSRRRLKSVVAAEAAALLAWHALDAGDRVGGIVFDDLKEQLFKPHRNARSVVRFLKGVADANRRLVEQPLNETPTADPLASAIDHATRIARTGHRLYLISDFANFSTPQRERLLRLARHNDVVLIGVVDPLDENLPPADRYAVTDGGLVQPLDTGDQETRSRYHTRFEDNRERVSSACMSAGMQFVTVSTDQSVVAPLRERLLV
jgi:uncharacterized protein (DUF58 family)